MPKATKEEALKDLANGDWEEVWGRKRKDKRRNCIFCGKNIPPEEVFYKNFEYPYINIPRWFCCQECFHKLKKEGKVKEW